MPSPVAPSPGSALARTAWPVAVVLGVSLLLLLLAAALAAAFAVARWDAQDQAVHAQADLNARAAQGAAGIADLLDGRLGLLALVATLPHGAAAPAAAGRPAGTWPTPAPAAPSLARVDERGRVTSPSTALRSGEDVSSRPWFAAAVRGPMLSEEPAVSAGDVGRPWLVQAVLPQQDEQHRTVSMLASPIDCAALAQHVAMLAPGPGGDAGLRWAIVGRDGRMRCSAPADVAPVGVAPPDEASAALMASHRVEGSDAVRRLAWRFVLEAPVPVALPIHQRPDVRRILLAGVTAALLAMPLVLLLAHRIGSPLGRLAASLDQARASYDYAPARIPVEGPRETAAVGAAARSMLTQISAQQRAMNASAISYRELFELHPLPMWVVDEDSLRFLEVNAAAVRKYGWRRDEFLGMTVLDIRPPEARAALAAAFTDTRDTERHSAVWQHRLRSGELIDVEIASRQLRWGGRAARIAAVMDVSSQRLASLQLQRQRRDLSQLAQQLMSTEEAERRELAQLLHDRFSPTLYGAKLSLEALRARAQSIADLNDLRSEVARVVAPLVQALDASIADTRGLMSDLRPPLLVEHGLLAALAHEAERQGHRDEAMHIIVTRGEQAGAAPVRHDIGLEYAMFMIAHEALHNALRHARAQQLTIDVDEDVDRIRLAISDDGCGFDSQATPPAGHLGLVGMRERARWIGAELTIDSVVGAGTTVRVDWRSAATA